MSASTWDWSAASADGLLTNEECSKLLDVDLFKHDDDILKAFPSAAPKIELDKFQLQDEYSSSLYPPSPPETKPSRAELANDLLQQLENNYKQENIFSNWLEEKVELPIFDSVNQVAGRVELPVPIAPVSNPVYQHPHVVPQPTEELLREFETVYGAVELTHLTPPQSPPGPATQLLLSYAQQAQYAPLAPAVPAVLQTQEQWPVAQTSALPAEYECDLQAVEDLVRHRAAQLQSGESVCSSPPSSPRSSSTDEEWSGPSRPKPYSRNVDDRRSRKKEQNKNAATRYRQKKKAEVEVLLSEEQNLRVRHNELNDKCSDLQREIRYIKGLMRDLLKAKGLIK